MRDISRKGYVYSTASRHYINVSASGGQADIIEEIGAGRLVNVNGVLKYREYAKSNNGETQIRSVYEVAARTIELLDFSENLTNR